MQRNDFAAADSSTDKPKVWLTDSVAIFNQGCDSTTVLTLCFKYWFYESEEIEDVKTADMAYLEMRNFIVEGVHKAKPETAIELASIQLQLEGYLLSQNNKFLTSRNAGTYLPRSAVDRHSLDNVSRQIQIYQQQNHELNRLDLLRKYLSLVRMNVTSVTSIFFPANYANRDMIRKLNLLIGAGPDGVGIYTVIKKTNTLFLETVIKYSDIQSVECKSANAASAAPATPDAAGAAGPGAAAAGMGSTFSLNEGSDATARKSDGENIRDAIEEQMSVGPHHYILKIFNKNKALREWKFDVYSYLSGDPGVASVIETYRSRLETYDQLLQTNPNRDYFVNVKVADGTLSKKLKIGALDTGEVRAQPFQPSLMTIFVASVAAVCRQDFTERHVFFPTLCAGRRLL